jgi:hypothetical protein
LSGFVPQSGSSICKRRNVSLGKSLAPVRFEPPAQFGVQVAHAHQQREDGREQNRACALCVPLKMKRFMAARSGSTSLVMRSTGRARADIHPR